MEESNPNPSPSTPATETIWFSPPSHGRGGSGGSPYSFSPRGGRSRGNYSGSPRFPQQGEWGSPSNPNFSGGYRQQFHRPRFYSSSPRKYYNQSPGPHQGFNQQQRYRHPSPRFNNTNSGSIDNWVSPAMWEDPWIHLLPKPQRSSTFESDCALQELVQKSPNLDRTDESMVTDTSNEESNLIKPVSESCTNNDGTEHETVELTETTSSEGVGT